MNIAFIYKEEYIRNLWTGFEIDFQSNICCGFDCCVSIYAFNKPVYKNSEHPVNNNAKLLFKCELIGFKNS